jgi:acyl-CoA thioester hydrolase
MSLDSSFKVKMQIRLDWSEMDLFGHINNVMYFKYLQASRVNYWTVMGIDKDFKTTNIAPILASTKCDFKKPLHFPSNIMVQAKIDFIKNSSFGIVHQILNEHGEIAAVGNDVMVMYDFNKNEKIVFPENLKLFIEEQEGRKI